MQWRPGQAPSAEVALALAENYDEWTALRFR